MNGNTYNQQTGRIGTPVWKGTIRPEFKKTRSKEIVSGDCPFTTARGYAGNVRICLKDVTIEYPEAAVSFGLNIGGNSAFATFRNTSSLRSIGQFIIAQCDAIDTRLPELEAKGKIMEQQIHEAQKRANDNQEIMRIMQIIQSGGQINPQTGEIMENPLSMNDMPQYQPDYNTQEP